MYLSRNFILSMLFTIIVGLTACDDTPNTVKITPFDVPSDVQVTIHKTDLTPNGEVDSWYINLTGHGMFYKDEYVLTAYHVVDDIKKARILTRDKEAFTETIRCNWEQGDTSLIKLNRPHGKTVPPFGELPSYGDHIAIIPARNSLPFYGKVLHSTDTVTIDGAKFPRQSVTRTTKVAYPGISGSPTFDIKQEFVGMAIATSKTTTSLVRVDLLKIQLPILEECIRKEEARLAERNKKRK